ncbi:MAG: hypothetical protein KDC05_16325, partial [Bacteroidales bacterium]|nr:hypothetical protein [Bacteroidales bacterium]
MTRAILLSVFMLLSTFTFSQAWEKYLPQGKKASGTLTLKDYEKAFGTYWAPYNVDENGYYYLNGEKIKAAGWKPFKRWAWRMHFFVGPNGEFPKTNDVIEWEKYKQKFPEATDNVAGNWTSRGMDHVDFTWNNGISGIGQMGCIAFHPTNTNYFWVGAGDGGLWKTTNGGANWQRLNGNFGVLGVADIAIPHDFATSNTLYVATGSRDEFVHGSMGVMKSTNGGITWTQTGLAFTPGNGGYIFRLLVDPTNSSKLIAATSFGVLVSTDGGETFSGNNLPGTTIVDLEFHPANPDYVYAGSFNNGKIYRSTDGGWTWDERYSTGGERVELAVTASSPNTIFAIAADGDGGMKGIYKSTSSGGNFFQKIDGTVPGNNFLGYTCDATDILHGQSWFDMCIAVSPLDYNEIVIGGILTWKSSDGGNSWYIINDGYSTADQCLSGYNKVHVDQHWLAYQPVSNTLFEVNDGGVYKSTDNTYNWINISDGLEVAQVEQIGVSQTNPDMVIAGIYHNGVRRLESNFWEVVKGGDGMNCLIDYSNENIQYASSQNGHIVRTDDNWNSSFTTIDGIGEGGWLTPFVIDPVNPQNFIVGTDALYTSTDRGNNCTAVYNPPGDSKIYQIDIAPSNTNIVYFSTNDAIYRLYKSTGTVFDKSGNLPLTSCYISSITVNDNDANTVYVTLTGYNEHGVYKTTNGGTSWTNISYGLPEVPVFTVVQNTVAASDEELYAGTSAGPFVKVNSETAWVPFNNQLPWGVVRELEIYYDGTNSKIIAATWGSGVWESDLYSYESDADEIWTGIKSTDWNDGDNWQYGVVPPMDVDITIPAGTIHSPVITGINNGCGNITIENGATLTLSGDLHVYGTFNNSGHVILIGSDVDLIVDGSVYFRDGSSADVQSDDAVIGVYGAWINEENAAVQLNKGIVAFYGSINQYIRNYSADSWFNNLTLNKDAGKYIYFSSSSTENLLIKGDLLITTDNLFRHYSDLKTTIEGNFANYGSFLGYGGTLEINGSGTIIKSNGSSYFNNLELSSGYNSFLDDQVINGDLIIHDGTLNANNATIQIAGNWEDIYDENAFIPGGSTVIFNGSTDQHINGRVQFNKLQLNKPGSSLEIYDEVTCNEYDWEGGEIRVSDDFLSKFVALDLYDNSVFGDYYLDNGTIELHNDALVHLCGNITIEGGDFEIYGSGFNSYWPGFTDASLTMTGGELFFIGCGVYLQNSTHSFNSNITGGKMYVTGNFKDDRGDFTPTNHELIFNGSNDATLHTTAGSVLGEIGVNLTDAKLSLLTDVDAYGVFATNGELDINGHELNLESFLTIGYNGSLTMTESSDVIHAGSNIRFYGGSETNITNGNISLAGDWYFYDGTLAQLTGSNTVTLTGDDSQDLNVNDPDASFNDLIINKT